MQWRSTIPKFGGHDLPRAKLTHTHSIIEDKAQESFLPYDFLKRAVSLEKMLGWKRFSIIQYIPEIFQCCSYSGLSSTSLYCTNKQTTNPSPRHLVLIHWIFTALLLKWEQTSNAATPFLKAEDRSTRAQKLDHCLYCRAYDILK